MGITMDLRKIKKLIDLLNTSDIGEIEVKSGDDSVRISKSSTHVNAAPMPQMTIPAPHTAAPAHTAEPASKPHHNGHEEKSPMVGTVYLASTPGEKPFVQIGQSISVGDTIYESIQPYQSNCKWCGERTLD